MESGHAEDRKVVPKDAAFKKLHCQHAHPGKNKTFDLIQQRFYGITKEEYVL